jgi:hypothetical protein
MPALSYVADLGGDEREAVEIINNGIRHGAPSRRQHPTRPLPPKARYVLERTQAI